MSENNWHKSTYSNDQSACVEVAHPFAVRDSKNPGGPVLRVDLAAMLSAVRSGRLHR